MTHTRILVCKETKKELKLFAVRNDRSMSNAIQLLLDREKERMRC